MAPNPKSYGGNGPMTINIVVAEFIITSVILFLRALSTFSVVSRPRWDLLWIITAYLCSVHALVFVILAIKHGMANHIEAIDPVDLHDAILFEWIFNVSTIMSTGFGKFAVAALLLEVQGPTHRRMRMFLYFVAGSTMTLAVFMTIFSWFQCSPSAKLWRMELEGRCDLIWPVLHAGVFQGSWSVASDFILAAYPAYIFWQLETSWKRRLGLCALFCGGAVAGVGAILKTVNIMRLGATADPPWEITPLIVWASTEMYLIIVMSSIPPLRPLVARLYRKAQGLSSAYGSSSLSRGHHATGGGGSSNKYGRQSSFDPRADEIEQFQASLRPDLRSADRGRNRTAQVQDSDSVNILLKDVGSPERGTILMTRDLSVQSSTYRCGQVPSVPPKGRYVDKF